TAASFDFFVSIHDFVKFIESDASFAVFLGEKAKRGNEIPHKYFYLKQIYQGIEDIDEKSTADLGHDRYVAIRELAMIRRNDVSDNNTLWKRRELFRKLANETYKILNAHLAA
ncbi:MAG: hypothetical protein KGJ13_07310, partial [Patescibacteria group bacterium]|nr:hypothetical protein [Patescibacteria group bacterium]